MRKYITLATACMLSMTALADDFNLYSATATSGSNKIESVGNLQKLTFENGTMVVIRKDGTTSTINLSSISKLYFSTEEAVGIEDVTAEDDATATKGEVYDLTGRKINIAPNNLPKGLYIIDGKKKFIR